MWAFSFYPFVATIDLTSLVSLLKWLVKSINLLELQNCVNTRNYTIKASRTLS